MKINKKLGLISSKTNKNIKPIARKASNSKSLSKSQLTARSSFALGMSGLLFGGGVLLYSHLKPNTSYSKPSEALASYFLYSKSIQKDSVGFYKRNHLHSKFNKAVDNIEEKHSELLDKIDPNFLTNLFSINNIKDINEQYHVCLNTGFAAKQGDFNMQEIYIPFHAISRLKDEINGSHASSLQSNPELLKKKIKSIFNEFDVLTEKSANEFSSIGSHKDKVVEMLGDQISYGFQLADVVKDEHLFFNTTISDIMTYKSRHHSNNSNFISNMTRIINSSSDNDDKDDKDDKDDSASNGN